MTIDWTQEKLDGIAWLQARIGQVEITIEPRPHYCDRGRFYAKIFDPTDKWGIGEQDGFPRYYFDLDVAKSEMEAFVARRTNHVRS